MAPKACSCGSTEIDTDQSRGISYCTACGNVLEENTIVSEVQFEENAYGGASAVGQFLSNDNQGGTGFINAYRGGQGKQSREITLKKAKDRISAMGGQLNLNAHCVDMALSFYSLALGHRLTNGRKSSHMVAACIYLTCRMEGTAHLLIDIADIIDINVYTLGHTFLQIAKALHLNIPSVDPCLYVMRYANRMDFGEKTHDVSKTALRLVQRMKRDWIHTGRRPSGLCGAALLIAARHHGFNRTVSDVIKEVKVHENTVRKRMQEFGETASANLTLEEFMQVDLDEEHDPPAFLKSRKKDRKDKDDDLATDEVVKLEEEINRQIALQALNKKRGGPWAKHAKDALLYETESPEPGPSRRLTGLADSVGDEEMDEVIADFTLTAVNECLSSNESEASAAADQALMPPPDATYLQMKQHLRPSLASLGVFDVAVPEDANQSAQESASDELDLSGIDDSELDNEYIRTPEEVEAQAEIWMALNGEYMVELEAKQKRRAEEEEEKNRRGEKRKRKVTRRPQQSYSANTPGEAFSKMVAGKKMSKKIDYEKLKNLGLFDAPVAGDLSTIAVAVEAEPESGSSADLPESSQARSNRPTPAASARRPAAKAPKLEKPPVVVAPFVAPPAEDDEEDEEDEELEEDDSLQSAASLLRGFADEDGGGYGVDAADYDY